MTETLDGEYQKFSVEDGAYFREHFFGRDPRLLALVEHLSDDQLRRLVRGGHDSRKVYAAYKMATEHRGAPTVILAKTLKGYGLGEAGEGRNVTHQQKKLNEEELREFRSRFGIPVPDDRRRRGALLSPGRGPPRDGLPPGATQGARRVHAESPGHRRHPSRHPRSTSSRSSSRAASEREVATTMAFVRLLRRLLRHEGIGARSCPSSRMRHGRSGWTRSSGGSGSIRTPGSSMSRSTRSRSSRTGKPRTARSSRKASPRPARCPPSSPPGRPTRSTASRWCRSTPSTRCSASSASATSSGRRRTRAPRASCWAAPPGAPPWPARGSSTRTATAT